jgi:hypothetical protein
MKRRGYLEVEQVENSFIKGVPSEDYLFSPINIEPKRTIEGSMFFLIPSYKLPFYGGREGLNFSSCLLDIVDHVSGKTLTKNIQQDVT